MYLSKCAFFYAEILYQLAHHSSTFHFSQLELNNSHDTLHGATNCDVDEEKKHSLGNEKALDCITCVFKGCAISIKQTLVFGTTLTLVGEAEDASDDHTGEVRTAAEAMAASTEQAARPENASGSEEDKEGKDAMDQVKEGIEL